MSKNKVFQDHNHNTDIVVIIITFIIMIIISVVLFRMNDVKNCKELVGENYILHEGECYQLIDGVPYRVDMSRERLIRKLGEERNE